ncbi:MAG: alpha/beta hydrolase family protein [bacterium]
MMKRLFLFLLLHSLAFSQQSDSSATPVTGYWEGAIMHEGSLQILKLEVEEHEGKLWALLTVPDWGIQDARMQGLTYTSQRLVFTLNPYGPTSLLVDAKAGEMRGTVTTGDSTQLRIQLKRTLKPVAPHARSEEVRFNSGEARMAGTLVLPAAQGPHPAIIIVSGRNYGSRWGNHSEALRLAQRGVACLIFDGRGVGESGGDRTKTTAADRYQDVLSALDLLAARTDLDANGIGLWGISAGGWVVPIVAQRSGKVAFIIMDAGPAESLAEQQGHVVAYNMRWFAKEKFAPEEIDAAYAYQKKLVELCWQDAKWRIFEPLVAHARQQRWAKYVDLPENLANSELDYFSRYKNFDNTSALRQMKIPVLAWYGERDYVVPPPENAPKLKRLLEEAGNQDFKILIFPEGDHGMVIPGGIQGEGEEWPERYYRWRRRAPGFYETIYAWILGHVNSSTN